MSCSIPAVVSRRGFLAGSAAAGMCAFGRAARARSGDGAVGLAEAHGRASVSSATSPLRAEKGVVRVPSGRGLGVVFDSGIPGAARVMEG